MSRRRSAPEYAAGLPIVDRILPFYWVLFAEKVLDGRVEDNVHTLSIADFQFRPHTLK